MDLFTVEPPKWLKPNLAGKYDPDKQQFPCYGSPKIDGVRALGVGGDLLSRTLKLIPNRFVQMRFADCDGLDGELVMGDPCDPNVMQKTVSAVMSYGGEPDVKLMVFDRWDFTQSVYSDRLPALAWHKNPHIVVVEQVLLNNQEELQAYETKCVELGYEGIMIRSPNALYKCGRSTVKEGGLLKVKRFDDDEAIVVGFQELLVNHNAVDEATFLRLGATKRSSHSAGMVPGDTLGALLCETSDGTEFGIGTGFTQDQRREIWVNQNKYLGRMAKYKHFSNGVKNAPRFPVFLGWRAKIDL